MEERILRLNFPLGSLPARGFRCPVCGEEEFWAGEIREAQAMAERLGLFRTAAGRPRKVHQHGNSLSITLSPDWLRRNGVKAGDEMSVSEAGDSLIVRPLRKER